MRTCLASLVVTVLGATHLSAVDGPAAPKPEQLIVPGVAGSFKPATTPTCTLRGATPYPYRNATVADGRQKAEKTLYAYVFFPPGWRPDVGHEAIAFFHGKDGGCQDFWNQCLYFASRDMVAVSADTVDDGDGRLVVQFLRANAEKLGVDPDAVACAGAAPTAALAGILPDPAGAAISGKANALALFHGSLKGGARPNVAPGIAFIGYHVQAQPERWVYSAALQFVQRMKLTGNRWRLVTYEEEAFDFYRSPMFQQEVNEQIEDFFAAAWDTFGLYMPLNSAAAAESGFIGGLARPAGEDDEAPKLPAGTQHAYRSFIQALPHHPLSWTFLQRLGRNARIAGRLAGELKVYEDFIRASGDGPNCTRALSHLLSTYRLAEDPPARIRQLGAAAKLSGRTLGDVLEPRDFDKATGGKGRTILQEARLDPRSGREPKIVVVSFRTRDGWRNHCYWSIHPNPLPVGEGVVWRHLGPTPRAGKWRTLAIPISAAGLDGKEVLGIGFSALGGQVWWDRTVYAADGAETVLIDDELPKGCAFAGPSAAGWVDDPVQSGKAAHTTADVAGFSGPKVLSTYYGFSEYHVESPHVLLDLRGGAPERAAPAYSLTQYRAAIDAIAGRDEAAQVLAEATRVAEREQPASGARLVRDFLTRHPKSPAAHRALLHLLSLETGGAVDTRFLNIVCKGAFPDTGRSLHLLLQRRGGQWIEKVKAWAAPFSRGRLRAVVRDKSAPADKVAVDVQTGRGREVPDGFNARYTLSLAAGDRWVQGAFEGTCDGQAVTGPVDGECRDFFAVDRDAGPDSKLGRAMAAVEAVMAKASIDPAQRAAFYKALGIKPGR